MTCPSFKDILLLSAYSFIGYNVKVPVVDQLIPALVIFPTPSILKSPILTTYYIPSQ